MAYRLWHKALPSFVEVCPVLLPGHAARFREPCFRESTPLIKALTDALAPELDRPFAIFGHSMGGLLGFEWARELRRRGLRAPQHLYVAGRLAPEASPTLPLVHLLSDEAMLDVMQRRYKAIPVEILNEPELLAMVLPVLRADMALFETYRYQAEAPIDIPITAYGGAADAVVNVDELGAWAPHTTKDFASHVVPGGHFFLHANEKEFLPLLATALERHRPR